jgi:hypothetical protein
MRMNLKEAAAEIGVGLPTASYWLRTGLIKPKKYTGRPRVPVRITEKELGELRTIKRLRHSVSLQMLREIMAYLRRLGFNPLSSGDVIAVGTKPGKKRLVKVCGPDEAIELSRKYRGQLILLPWWNEDKES